MVTIKRLRMIAGCLSLCFLVVVTMYILQVLAAGKQYLYSLLLMPRDEARAVIVERIKTAGLVGLDIREVEVQADKYLDSHLSTLTPFDKRVLGFDKFGWSGKIMSGVTISSLIWLYLWQAMVEERRLNRVRGFMG